MNNLYTTYKKDIAPKLAHSLKLSNPMSVPKMVKIVVNMGLGEAREQKNVLQKASEQLKVITGQQPKVTRAKKAISTFKLRAGDTIGLKVTLRGLRMYDFLKRLIAIALPRVRDFRGLPIKGFDGRGNYTLGLSELTIFPELSYQLVDKVRGAEITIVTSADSQESAYSLLSELGIPFEKKDRLK